mgnify:CR=1 FL=1
MAFVWNNNKESFVASYKEIIERKNVKINSILEKLELENLHLDIETLNLIELSDDIRREIKKLIVTRWENNKSSNVKMMALLINGLFKGDYITYNYCKKTRNG